MAVCMVKIHNNLEITHTCLGQEFEFRKGGKCKCFLKSRTNSNRFAMHAKQKAPGSKTMTSSEPSEDVYSRILPSPANKVMMFSMRQERISLRVLGVLVTNVFHTWTAALLTDKPTSDLARYTFDRICKEVITMMHSSQIELPSMNASLLTVPRENQPMEYVMKHLSLVTSVTAHDIESMTFPEQIRNTIHMSVDTARYIGMFYVYD